MDAHLSEESRQNGNRRNGKMQKQVQTPVGTTIERLSAKMYTFAHSWIYFVWRQKSNENGLTSQMKSALFLCLRKIFIGQQ